VKELEVQSQPIIRLLEGVLPLFIVERHIFEIVFGNCHPFYLVLSFGRYVNV
jgi:hypothetical protein